MSLPPKHHSDQIVIRIQNTIAAIIVFGGLGFLAGSCKGIGSVPEPTGVSVQGAPNGGVETCVTWAAQQGCICPSANDAGPGK